MRLYLVRHGESLGNVDKSVHHTTADFAIPLSERGKQQAAGAGRFLRSWLDAQSAWLDAQSERRRLWVSPYLRARQTADEMEKEALFGDRREHILLGEQDFGLFDGYDTEELAKRLPKEQAHYQKCEDFGGRFWARMPMGESRFDVCQRVHQAFGTFHRDADKHRITTLVIIAHGTTIRAIVMMWLHKTVEWFEAEPNPDNCSIRLLEDDVDRGVIYPGGDPTPEPWERKST